MNVDDTFIATCGVPMPEYRNGRHMGSIKKGE